MVVSMIPSSGRKRVHSEPNRQTSKHVRFRGVEEHDDQSEIPSDRSGVVRVELEIAGHFSDDIVKLL